MSELDALLSGLRDRAAALAKAQPAPKEEAAPAAAEETVAKAEGADAGEAGKPGSEPAAAEGAAAEEAREEGSDEELDFGKSFEITLADGTKAQGVDAIGMFKSLFTEVKALKAEVAALKEAAPAEAAPAAEEVEGLQKSFADGMAAADERATDMAKALATAMDALSTTSAQVGELTAKVASQADVITAQEAVVKALDAKLTAFGAQGRGRQSTVSVQERPSTTAATAQPQPTVGELFAKAQSLNAAGKLNAIDVSRINAWVNAGRGVPPEFQALFAA